MRTHRLLVLSLFFFLVNLVPAVETGGPPPAARQAQLLNASPARNIGPANSGGRITELAVVEANPSTFYVAVATGGVWKTNDDGQTWRPILDAAATQCVGAVAVSQANPDVVWVGTGEGNILRSVGTGMGVYKSVDGGKTFRHMGLGDTRHISRIVIHPKDPDTVYVAALGHAWGPNPERGVFKTIDGGKTWEKVLYVDDTTGATDLAIDPAEPQILYACAYTFHRDAFSGTAPRTQFGVSRELRGRIVRRLQQDGIRGPGHTMMVTASALDPLTPASPVVPTEPTVES